MTLYEIKEAYLEALESIVINEDGEILNLDAIEIKKGEFDEKAEAVAIYIKELKAEAEAVHNELDNLKKREKSLLNKAESLTNYLADNLKAMGKENFKTSKAVVAKRISTSVFIDDEEAFFKNAPKEYINETITMKPNKTAIKDALKAGKEISNAYLKENENWSVR